MYDPGDGEVESSLEQRPSTLRSRTSAAQQLYEKPLSVAQHILVVVILPLFLCDIILF